MKKEMILTPSQSLTTRIKGILSIILQYALLPLQAIAHYYSSVLEREVNIPQTLWLINAQCAVFALICSVESSFLTILFCLVWSLHAIYQCKTSF